VDFRKKNWHSKDDNEGPETFKEVRADVWTIAFYIIEFTDFVQAKA
jgi:hypothetical protein